jgi:HD-GYP domain-containing protein (c-di-GMP phosphodiesterase class II)
VRYRAAPMKRRVHDPEHRCGGPSDPELTAVHQQLIVFAHELGQLCRLERSRSEELERVLQGLQDMYLATMRSLAQVIEAKDQTTRGHLDRTQALGMALARRIDPALADRPELGYGFFLHDIGKVGIPEHILCKVGPLTSEEWEVVRTHPAVGAKIVAPIRFLGEAALVIRHHHEWFDGGGYPDGLGGTAIPLAARVFAVADSFDAMTSDRPYRSALTHERALEEIREGAGTQFDPGIVSVFVDMIEEEPALAATAYGGTGQFCADESGLDEVLLDRGNADLARAL